MTMQARNGLVSSSRTNIRAGDSLSTSISLARARIKSNKLQQSSKDLPVRVYYIRLLSKRMDCNNYFIKAAYTLTDYFIDE